MRAGELWMVVDRHMTVGRAAVAWQENRRHITSLYQGMMLSLAQIYIRNSGQV